MSLNFPTEATLKLHYHVSVFSIFAQKVKYFYQKASNTDLQSQYVFQTRRFLSPVPKTIMVEADLDISWEHFASLDGKEVCSEFDIGLF